MVVSGLGLSVRVDGNNNGNCDGFVVVVKLFGYR